MRARELHINCLASDDRYGRWFLIMGAKEQVEIRLTNSGRLRVGKPQKRDHPFPPSIVIQDKRRK